MSKTGQSKLLEQTPPSPVARKSLLLDPKLIEEREYWVKRLGRVRERGQLWAEGERVKASGRARCQGEMGGEVWQGMLRLSEGGGLLLYTTVVAAMKICLARYSGSEVVVVGSPARRGKGKGKGNGRCAWGNVVAVVDEVSGGERVQELLQQVKGSLLEAYGRQQYGLERLVKELGLKGAEDLFDVVVSFAELHEEVEGVEGDVEGSVVVRLERKEAGLSWAAEYEEREGGEERVRGLLRHMETVLEQMVAQPERRVGELRLLGEEEREQVLVEWNRTEMEYGQEQCIHELFEQQAERRPEAVAVEFGEQRLSYGELERRSNELAQYLREQGVGPEAVVGIWQERSLEMVESVLGVLKAGGGYLPVDEECPQERVKWMLEEAGVKVLLTEEERGEGLEQAGWRGRRLDVRGKREEIGKRSGERVGSGVCAANLAYVIYTSGSTGRPKGVQIQHGGIVNLVEATRAPFAITPQDAMLQFASLSFDPSVWEMWLALSTGARLVLGKKETMRSVAELRDLMRGHQVSMAIMPPSMAAVLEEHDLPDLRFLLVGGERCTEELVRRWAAGRMFFNAYGLTEQTVAATLEECGERCEQDPPLGRALGNTQLYVLDEELQPVPVGMTGELYIGGMGLGRGYIQRPDLTGERFVPHPFGERGGERLYRTGDLVRYREDGKLEFTGRRDEQVKVRGYRIELGEIESALKRLKGVREAAVVMREDKEGGKRLVGYVVWASEEPYNRQDLRAQLKHTLPEYMVPAALVRLDRMPTTGYGKIDRKALPADEEGQFASEGNIRDGLEFQVLEIWERILGTAAIGIHDNFFDIGGHSLAAVRVMAEIQKQFGVNLPVAIMFEASTIAQVSDILRRQDLPSVSALVALSKTGKKPPFFCVHPGSGEVLFFLNLARCLSPEQPFYALQDPAMFRTSYRESTIPEMAAAYISTIRECQPQGPYYLGGWSFGGLIAFEMARQLVLAGHEIGSLVLLDVWGPRFVRRFAAGAEQAILLEIIARELDLPLSATILSRLPEDQQLDLVIAEIRKRAGLLPHANQAWLARQIMIFRFRLAAATQYEPERYSGKITLIRASEVDPKHSSDLHKLLEPHVEDDPTVGWGDLSLQPVDVRWVPGTHVSMGREPNVTILAEQLKTALRTPQTCLL